MKHFLHREFDVKNAFFVLFKNSAMQLFLTFK